MLLYLDISLMDEIIARSFQFDWFFRFFSSSLLVSEIVQTGTMTSLNSTESQSRVGKNERIL